MATQNTVKTTPKQMPWIMPASCEGCGACVMQCPTGCLQMKKTNQDGVEYAWIKDPEQCIGCGRCAKVCGMGALSMTRYTQMAKERFQKARHSSSHREEEDHETDSQQR